MSGYNMAANMYGMFPSAYNNQVALNDLCDLDMYSPMGGMGMNGSVFGSPMMGGMGMPMMPPMFGGMNGNYQNYYKNYEQYQDFMIDSQVRRQQKMRGADLKMNSPQEGISKAGSILREKIMQDEQQQIIPAYKAFCQSIKNLYGDVSDEEVANRAATLYNQMYGTTITDDIRQKGKGSFWQGALQSMTFGFADNKTSEENIAELTGQPVSRYDNAKKIAGNVAGGAVIGTGCAIAAKLTLKNLGGVAKFFTRIPVLAAIGGSVAAFTSFANSDSKK